MTEQEEIGRQAKAYQSIYGKVLEAMQCLLNECQNEEEMSIFAQAMAMIGSDIIHGIEGQEFKKGFLTAAIESGDMLKPIKIKAH